jgi:hypothetical protein
MKEIDIKWLQRIDKTLDKKERGIASDSKEPRRNEKEIFIDRYFKFLQNKAFKLLIKEKIYYALFSKSRTTTVGDDDYYHYSYGVNFYNGYSTSEYLITFIDEKGTIQSFKLHWNDIIRIKYEEISIKEYTRIVKIFVK